MVLNNSTIRTIVGKMDSLYLMYLITILLINFNTDLKKNLHDQTLSYLFISLN